MTSNSKDWPGAPLPFTWAVLSDIGRERERNEDAFAVEPEAGLFLVVDGMGGHRGGQVASKIIAQDLPPAIETRMAQSGARGVRAVRRILQTLVAEQSRQVYLEATSESGFPDMGATLILALILDGRAYLTNLGDSRGYRYRRGRLHQFSQDHSVVAELLEEGHITETEAEDHEDQGVVTRYIGMDARAQARVRSFALQPSDRLLLCTDGLTDMLSVPRLRSILRSQPDAQACCRTLIEEANAAGGHDNITAMIIDWKGSS
jgi:protein phosphatase